MLGLFSRASSLSPFGTSFSSTPWLGMPTTPGSHAFSVTLMRGRPRLGRPERGQDRHDMADRLAPEPLEFLAHVRSERRAGVDEGLQVGEQALAQARVRLDIGQQHLEALRHVVVDGRRHVAEVADRRLDRAGQGPSLVDVERAAARQDEIEIVVAAEGVAPGQPVDQHRGDRAVARVDAFQHRLVRRHHPLGVDHALGRAGRTGGEQELGDRVGTDLRLRRVDLGAGGLGRERFECRRGPALRRIGPGDHLDVLRHARCEGERELRPVGDIDEARRQDRRGCS